MNPETPSQPVVQNPEPVKPPVLPLYKKFQKKYALFAAGLFGAIIAAFISVSLVSKTPKDTFTSPPGGEPTEVVDLEEHSTFGLRYTVPNNWLLVSSDDNGSQWNVFVGTKQAGTLSLRRNRVRSLETPVEPTSQKQEITENEDGFIKTKKVEIEGTTVTSNVEVVPESQPEEGYILELVVPEQQNLSTEESLEVHTTFEEISKSLAVVNEVSLDNLKAEVQATKPKAKADGIDTVSVTVKVSDQSQSGPEIFFQISSTGGFEKEDIRTVVKSPMPTARINSAATVIGETALVAGGVDYNTRLVNSELYDFANDSWSTTAPTSYRRDGATLNILNGKAYLLGGHKDYEDLRDNPDTGEYDLGSYNIVEVFEPVSKTWSKGPQMLQVRALHGSTVVNNKLYVFGGQSQNVATCESGNEGGNIEVFDPATNSWEVESESELCNLSSQYAAAGNKIYYFGGMRPYKYLSQLTEEQLKDQKLVDEALFSNETFIYDLENKTLERGPAMPHARARGAAVVINDLIYLIGGLKPVERDIYDWRNEHIDVYNPAANTWTTLGALYPTPIDFSAVAYNRKIYTFGGDHMYSWPSSSAVWEIDLFQVVRGERKTDNQNEIEYSFRSLKPGVSEYKVIAYTDEGVKELGQFTIEFE